MKKRLNEILTRVKRKIEVCEYVEYKQVTIRRWNKGVVLRKIEIGNKIKTKNQFVAKKDDFIFCRLNAHSGAVGFINDELDNSIVTNDFPLFTLDNEIVDLNWFSFFIKSKRFNEICLLSTSGSAQSRIQIETLLKHEIHLPPLEEQIRIAKRLEEAERQSLSIQSESDRLLQDISDFRQEILTRAFRGDLTEQNFDEGTGQDLLKLNGIKSSIVDDFDCPPNWTMLNHNDALSISGGSQPAKAFFSDEPIDGYIQMYQTRDYGERPQPVYIPEKFATKRTKEGDILLARYGGSLGKVFKAKEGAYNVALAKVVQSYELFSKEFLWWYYNSNNYKDFVKGVSRSAQAGFNKDDMNSMVVPLPPLAEQERIVAKIEAIFSALDVMEDAITKQKEEAKACYEEILRKEIGTADKESEETVEVKVG